MTPTKTLNVDHAIDGAWISPDGHIYHVGEYGHHCNVLDKLSDGRLDGYSALVEGWARLGMNKGRTKINVEIASAHIDAVTLRVLRVCVDKLRSELGARFECMSDASADWNYNTVAHDYRQFCGFVSRLITEKLVCQKNASANESANCAMKSTRSSAVSAGIESM